MENVHSLLKRQLKKHTIDISALPVECQNVLATVNEAYHNFDADRLLLERSLDLSSQELVNVNSRLRSVFQAMPDVFLQIDEDMNILDYKEAAEVQLECQGRSFFIGKKVGDILGDRVAEIFKRAVAVVQKYTRIETVEFSTENKGKVCYFEARFAPLLGRQCIVIIRDITTRKQVDDAIKESEQYFRAIIENSSDIIVIVNKICVITYASPSAERYLGYKPEELVGKNAFSFIAPADIPRATYDFAKAVLTKEVNVPNSFRVRRKDGSEIILEGVGRNLLNDPAVGGFVMNVRDVTERRRAEEEIRQAKEQAEIANRTKSVFLANISHELRTPLTAVIGFSDLLRDMALEDPYHEYVDIISESGQLLMGLINDVLDVSKIEAGQMVLEEVDFDLDMLVENTIRLFRHSFQRQEQVELVYDVHPDVPRSMCGDPVRLRQILTNLFSNALKFTKAGFVHLSVCNASPSIDDPVFNVIECRFKDTGIGITEENKTKIFNAFVQGDSSVTRRYGGSGLGLYIVKVLVEMMGGSITVDSSPGHGSEFIVTVRIKKSKQNRSNLVLDDAAGMRGKTVALVDSHSLAVRACTTNLTRLGLKVVSAHTTFRDMLSWLKSSQELPSALFCDLSCPDMDWHEFLEIIRKEERYQAIKLFGMTHKIMPPDVKADEKPRFDGFLMKPFIRSEVMKCMIGSASPDAGLSRAAAAITVPPDEAGQGKKLLVVEDNPINLKLIKIILEQLGFIVDTAANGAEALEKVKGNKSYALILMDIQMPVMDGIEATKRIREGIGERIPIVALTAAAMKEDMEAVFSAGMDDYITKPVTPDKIKAKVTELLRSGGAV